MNVARLPSYFINFSQISTNLIFPYVFPLELLVIKHTGLHVFYQRCGKIHRCGCKISYLPFDVNNKVRFYVKLSKIFLLLFKVLPGKGIRI